MDRLALGAIVAALGLLTTLVVTVLGQPANTAVPAYAAVVAALAGVVIVAALVVLERRTRGPFARNGARI